MVKKMLAVLLALLLLPAASWAEAAQVIDDAQLLAADEEAEVQSAIDEVEAQFPVDLVVLLTYDVPDDDSETLWRVREYAEAFYDNGGYGAGEDRTGMLYLIDLNNSVQWICTCGGMIQWIGDAGEERIFDATDPHLMEADWEAACLAALRETEQLLNEAGLAAGPTADAPSTVSLAVSLLPLAVLLSLVVLGGGM